MALGLAAALRGWTTGALAQVGSVVGRSVGLLTGCWCAPRWAPRVTHGAGLAVVLVGMVVLTSVIGARFGRLVGKWCARRLPLASLRYADRLVGMTVSVAGLAAVVWLVAALAANMTWFGISERVNQSLVVTTLQRLLPAPPALLGGLQSLVSGVSMPNVLALVGSHQLPSLPRVPSMTVERPPGLVRVTASGGCVAARSATGAVVGPGEVVTTAHILAGYHTIQVDGRAATVVAFDSRIDLAVLRVPGLVITPLQLARPLPARSAVVIATMATATTGVEQALVTVASRGLYGGAVAPRTIALVTTNGPVRNAIVEAHGALAGVVIAPSPVTTGVALVVPVASISQTLANVGRVPVATHGCVG